MVGIIIVTHGPLAHALVETAEMIVGSQDNVHAVALNADGNLDRLRDKVEALAVTADTGQGLLVLVDMPGGTPANAVASGLRCQAWQCLCGVNLPMVLEALLLRQQMPLAELAARVESAACQGVVNLNAALERQGNSTEPDVIE